MVNTRDPKENFVGAVDVFGVEYPAVCKQEGGAELFAATGSSVSYIAIYPDKTYKEVDDFKTEIERLGIPPHKCATSIDTKTVRLSRSRIAFYAPSSDLYKVTIPSKGYYTIRLYAMDGTIHQVLSRQFLSAGTHTLQFTGKKQASGLYCIEICNGVDIFRDRVLLK